MAAEQFGVNSLARAMAIILPTDIADAFSAAAKMFAKKPS